MKVRGRRILVVEDSPTQAERIRLLLASEGHRAELAGDGREGLAKAQSIVPDLVITDVLMPEMDGFALCRALKSAEATRRIPVVLLTSLRTPMDIVRGLEGGADNFITKPFEDEYLLDRVRRIFENLAHREKGGLEMEVSVRVAGREIVVNADKQQMIELLFSTSEELSECNKQLEEARLQMEEQARDLERKIDARTRELREAEEKHRALVEHMPAVVYIAEYARIGRTLYISPQIEALLGFAPAEWLADPGLWTRQTHPGDRERVDAEFEHLRESGVPARSEYRMLARDGHPVWVRDEARVVRSGEGGGPRVQGIIVDITGARRAEEEIRVQRDALYQSEKIAAMGTLLAGVAHELNNPLAVVMGQASLLQRRAGAGPLANRAQKIVQAAERCARIVANFLALARQRPPERRKVSLNKVVEEAFELLGYPLRVDDVEVRLALAADLPALWADPHQLHQVVVNLVTNAHHALRANPPPRRITAMTRVERERVVLEVADTGPGIPPEVRSRLFEPFFTTKPPGQGTGLGLSLCLGIVETHGGTIAAESEPGQGAAFRVELPVEAPSENAVAIGIGEQTAPVEGKAILVVDDEQALSEMLAEMLSEDGHRVDTAPNGAAALEKLAAGSYDVVFSDIKMPLLDGPGLYREVERHDPQLARRFIFLTGDSLSPETRAFLEKTGRPNAEKPVSQEDLRRAIRSVLAGS